MSSCEHSGPSSSQRAGRRSFRLVPYLATKIGPVKIQSTSPMICKSLMHENTKVVFMTQSATSEGDSLATNWYLWSWRTSEWCPPTSASLSCQQSYYTIANEDGQNCQTIVEKKQIPGNQKVENYAGREAPESFHVFKFVRVGQGRPKSSYTCRRKQFEKQLSVLMDRKVGEIRVN